MNEIDDLLTQRRRGELSDADERRLRSVVDGSREHQLSLLAGEAFERAGAAQPGDDALVRQIVRQVEGEWSGTFQRVVSRRRRFSRWVSIPLLIAGAAAASYGGYHSLDALRSRAGSSPAQVGRVEVSPAVATAPTAQLDTAPTTAAPAPAPAPELELERASEPAAASQPVPTSASAGAAPRARRTKPSQPLRASAPLVVASASRGLGPAPDLVEPAPVAAQEPAVDESESARELFRRATRLRQTDWEAAAALYEQLTLRYSESAEAGVAEMALGKHALSEGHAEQALRWFRAYQGRPAGELAAEALWGQARALESLGEISLARELWRQLREQYPGSAYAAAAREQLGP